MNKADRDNPKVNPEILYEREKEKSRFFFDEDLGEMRLFPGFLAGSGASATESTGLIQTAPVTPAVLEAFDDVYSYRRSNAQPSGQGE